MSKCKECGGTKIYHNEGISQKNNRPYENYKCADCGYVEWVREEKRVDAYGSYKKPSNGRKEPDWEKIRNEKAEGLAKGAAFNKAVDVVIAAYNKGEIKFEDIPIFVEKVHRKFTEINLFGLP